MDVAEWEMLRFSLGVTKMDRIINKYIRRMAQVGRFGDQVREARMRCYDHVQRGICGISGEEY